MLTDFTRMTFNVEGVHAWSWERDAVKTREEKAAKLDAMIAASWAAHNARKNESVHKNEFEGLSADAVSWAMGYNRGNGFYCGD